MGFTNVGVQLGSWASKWQSYLGDVSKETLQGKLFGYFQSAGVKMKAIDILKGFTVLDLL